MSEYTNVELPFLEKLEALGWQVYDLGQGIPKNPTTSFRSKFEEVVLELENPEVWNNPEHAQALGKERSMLESVINTIDKLESGLQDAAEFLEMAELDEDQETFQIVCSDLEKLKTTLEDLEFRKMFSGPMDANNAFIDINSLLLLYSLTFTIQKLTGLILTGLNLTCLNLTWLKLVQFCYLHPLTCTTI